MNNVKRKTKILLIIREKKKKDKEKLHNGKPTPRVLLDLALSNKCATIINISAEGKKRSKSMTTCNLFNTILFCQTCIEWSDEIAVWL